MCQVSIVMSVYNAENYLGEAIESILNQTFSEFEFIIVNDGSSDRSKQIIESYDDTRIKLINQPNQGLSKALNTGVKSSNGKYIARMDADDIALSTRLEKQVAFLETNPACVVLGTRANCIDMNGEFLFVLKYSTSWKEIQKVLPESPLCHPSTMFRKNTFGLCKGYIEGATEFTNWAADKILWNNMAQYGELRNLEEPLVNYRIVPSSITTASSRSHRKLQRISKLTENKDSIEDDVVLKDSKLLKDKNDNILLANYHLRIGKIYLEYNFNRKKAAQNIIKSLMYYPFSLIAIVNLTFCFFPKKLVVKWKRSRGLNLD